MPVVDLLHALDELDAVDDFYEECERFYEGDTAEVFASEVLRKLLEDTSGHFPFNFSGSVVRAVLDKLRLDAVTSPDDDAIDEGDDSRSASAVGEDTINGQLEALWQHNELGLEQVDVHRWTLVYGEAYVLVWPSGEPGEVDITYESPRQMRLFYDPENPRRKAFAAKVWEAADGQRRVNLYYPDAIEKWVQKPDTKGDQADDWEPYVEEWREAAPGELIEARFADPDAADMQVPAVLDGQQVVEARGGEAVPDWPLRNPFGEVPVFHFRTERPHGRPEHKDAWGPQRAIDKLVTAHMSNVDFTTFPQRYEIAGHTVGGEPQDFPQDDDPDIVVDDDDREDSTFTASPAALWRFPEGTEVGQFEVAGPDPFLKPIHAYVRSMAALTDTPIHKFEGMSGSNVSGETVSNLDKPLHDKAEKRIEAFSPSWQRALQFSLLVLNLDANRDGVFDELNSGVGGVPLSRQQLVERAFPRLGRLPDLTLHWAPVETADEKSLATTLQALRGARVISTWLAVQRLNPTWDEQAIAEEVQRIFDEEATLGAPEDLDLLRDSDGGDDDDGSSGDGEDRDDDIDE